jgi:hypothetical protein
VLIRKEQMNAFQQATDSIYEMRLFHFLQNQFPDAAREAEVSLVEGIKAQIAKARGYGLLTERQIAVYITSAWLMGGDFDQEFPAAREMLRSNVTPDDKSDWLERFTEELFDRLEQRI